MFSQSKALISAHYLCVMNMPYKYMRRSSILLLFYGVLGFTQILPGVSINYWARDELRLSPSATGAATSIISVPWICKPLIGFISDCVPLFGYRRKSYLIAASFAASGMWIALAAVPAALWSTILLGVATQVCIVTADVVADGLVVQYVHKNEKQESDRGKMQSATWSCRFGGSIAASFLSGFVLEFVPPRVVFAMTALPLFTMGMFSIGYKEKRVASTHTSDAKVESDGWEGTELNVLTGEGREIRATSASRIRAAAHKVWHIVRQKAVWRPSMFLLALAATPSSAASMFFFFTQPKPAGGLGFSSTFIGVLTLIGSLSGIIGVQIYRRTRARHMPLRTLLKRVTWFVAIFQCTELILVTRLNVKMGISDHIFVATGDSVEDIVESIGFLPLMVLVARLCPPGVESSVYATIIALSNMGGIIARMLGAAIARACGVTAFNFSRLWLVSLICTVSIPVPLFILKWLPNET
jgi:folate/biopterin transporter